jgi:hypothetical protein
MVAIEDKRWTEIVKNYLVAGPSTSLPKAQQQTLAVALQEWSAHCITAHLQAILDEQERNDLTAHIQKEDWQIHHKGKDFLGAVRWQEVDVWLTNPEAGLVLAVDPKHFQSQDSLKKNWKNGHNDLVAFATNLHERFPLCAVGGVIAFPEWAAAAQDLKQMHSICGRSIPRERPLNAYGKFEGFALAVYDEQGKLVWPFKSGSPLKPSAAFAALAGAVYQRTVALL